VEETQRLQEALKQLDLPARFILNQLDVIPGQICAMQDELAYQEEGPARRP
jgi:hypothetical protein